MERRVFNLRRQPGLALISSPRSAGIPRRWRNTFIDCWPQGRSIRLLIVRPNLMPAVDLTSLGSLQAAQRRSAIPCSGTACTFRPSAWIFPASVAIGLMALADGLLVNGIVFLARF